MSVAGMAPFDFTRLHREADAFTHEDPRLRDLMRASLINIVDLIDVASDGTAYVRTGDIPASWLRDSSVQARYLNYFADDPGIARVLRSVIAYQARRILIDPYANAFVEGPRIREHPWEPEQPGVWERKFEIDSLAHPILLAWTFWKVTGDSSVFMPEVRNAFDLAIATLKLEQDHTRSRYRFDSDTEHAGINPVANGTGLIWSGFRPSDDVCVYNFPISQQMQVVAALGALQEIARHVHRDTTLDQEAGKLRREVHAGIERHGVIDDGANAPIYAYEVDGLGNSIVADDANFGLLSAPYFGYVTAHDPVYRSSRGFILSERNPHYHTGFVASGIGSPHTPKGWIWPLALVMQGLTTDDRPEQEAILAMLLGSDRGDHRFPESFDPNNARNHTRENFGMPHGLFVEFYLTKFLGRPALPMPNTNDLRVTHV